VAILFPVFAKARENARRASCQSNLKQMALSEIQYMQDNDGRFSSISPNAPFNNITPSAYLYGWADALYPYAKNTQIYQCPSEPAKSVASPASIGYTDYWFNAWLDNPAESPSNGSTAGILAASVAYPSTTVLFGDGSGSRSRYNIVGYLGGDSQSVESKGPGSPTSFGATISSYLGDAARRHLGGSTYAFIDGHVKWLPGDSGSQCTKITAGNAAVTGGGTYSFRPYK
jgi:prepilin-type processing-associated H-X9-DG protein